MNRTDTDAEKIADLIVAGDLNSAKAEWEKTISQLKAFEAIVLRDKIQKIVERTEKQS